MTNPTSETGRNALSAVSTSRDLLHRLAQAWHLRQAERAMRRLDESALHDIGVGFSRIEDAVRHGRDGSTQA